MNLEDVIDPEYGLQQDEWSLTRPRFGGEGQLEVIGWSGWSSGGEDKSRKSYILKCSVCSNDEELFGHGFFKSTKSNLQNLRQTPCGCAVRVRWSREQYSVLCKRKAQELGFKFIGFDLVWGGVFTKIRLSCARHGEWCTSNISQFLNKSSGCPSCKTDKFKEKGNLKSDEVMINSFMKTNAFAPGTVFWRSDRVASNGVKAYWYVSCPICGEVGESRSGHLQMGQVTCGCSSASQKQAYINRLVTEQGAVVALKFGIARNSKTRLKAQSSKSAYIIECVSVYIFETVKQCKKAERECKQELERGVVLKRDMPDGYTETTWVYNLEKIEEIYKRNGGVKLE